MPKVGVVLSGCGLFDGSEIHEAVCVLLALSQAGVAYQCLAPNAPQMHVVDHVKKQPAPHDTRNTLTESARIARGDILPLSDVKTADYDAFIFPGGFGAAKNLCTWAVEGANCSVQPDVARVIKEAHAAKKVLAFICIAPVIAAKVLGKQTGLQLTIGDDKETADSINAMGAKHMVCMVTEAVVDQSNRVVSTPAYMKACTVAEVFAGVQRAVEEVLKLLKS